MSKKSGAFGSRRRRKTRIKCERGDYLAGILALGPPEGVGLHHVIVAHEPDCPMLKGKGYCDCHAIVERGAPPGWRG